MALLALSGALALPAQAQTCTLNTGDGDIWCGVVTVEAFSIGSLALYGFGPGKGGLSDTSFTYGSNNYTIDVAAVELSHAILVFSLTSSLTAEDRAALELHVDGRDGSFDFSDSDHYDSSSHTYSWTGTGLGWLNAPPVTLRLRLAPEAPGKPTNLVAEADGGTRIELSWDAPADDGGFAITGYRIEVSDDGGSDWDDLVADTGNDDTSYTHTGLSPGDTRHYRVSAINAEGTSEASDSDYATTPVEVTPGVEVTLHLSDDEPLERAGRVTVTATVSPASPVAFTVEISASPVAPATDDDFTLSTDRTLSFAADATESTGTVTIRMVDDEEREPDDVVRVSGAVSEDVGIPDPDEVTLTIRNDDSSVTSVVVASEPQSGDTYRLHETIVFTVTFSEPVELKPHGRLRLKVGLDNPGGGSGNSVEAVFSRLTREQYPTDDTPQVSRARHMHFEYKVKLFDRDRDGVRIRSNALRLASGARIRSEGGDDAELDHAGVGPFSDHKVDARADVPTIERIEVVSTPRLRWPGSSEEDTYGEGENIRIGVRFDQPVHVEGEPTMALAVGDPCGSVCEARYESGSGTDTLVFAYLVLDVDFDRNGIAIPSNPIKVLDGDIRNDAGEEAHLSFEREGTQSGHKVDGSRAAGPYLSVEDAEAHEVDREMDFTVRLEPHGLGIVTVDYETRNGSARAGSDYTETSGTLRFNSLEMERTVTVPIIDDAEEDDGETFTLRLSNPAGAALRREEREATGTIRNSDPEASPLTASFEDVPAEHDGESAFTLRMAFSESLSMMNGRRLREDVVAVAGGRATNAGRVDRRRDLWELTVEPDSRADVTVTLAAGAACGTPAAICTSDGRSLSEGISTTVAGPADEGPQPNTPATGAPAIGGTPQVGGELTASTSDISDADGLDDARFAYQWLRTDTDIQGATGSTYTVVEADEGERLKVRVSFTDDAGNAESVTSAATEAVAARPEPLTASFEDVPAEHDGESAFTLRIASSDRLSRMNGRRLREDVVAVSGGRATNAGRVNRRRDLWELTVEPLLVGGRDGDARGRGGLRHARRRCARRTAGRCRTPSRRRCGGRWASRWRMRTWRRTTARCWPSR